MKKLFIYCAVFIVSFLVFLVATAPASLLLNQVKLPKNIVIQGVSGSVWHAKAQKVHTPETVIEQVEAKLDWLSLFSFSPKVDITFGGAMLQGPEGYLTVSMHSGVALVENANLILPANLVAQRLPLPLPITANGVIEFEVPSYIQGKPLCEALTGKVNWRRAKITALEETVTLGRLSGDLSCDKGSIALKVTEDNALGLSYHAFVGANGRISGNGYLTPGSDFPEQLKSVLPFLGSPDAQGRYRLRL